MMRVRFRSAIETSLAGALIALAAAGCSSDGRPVIVPVKGVVLYNGTPVENAVVQFHLPGCPIIAGGTTSKDGTFAMTSYGRSDGAPVGVHKVTVSKRLPAPSDDELKSMIEKAEAEADPEERQKLFAQAKSNGVKRANLMAMSGRHKKSQLPAKYADVGSSPLEADVQKGQANEFEFSLTD